MAPVDYPETMLRGLLEFWQSLPTVERDIHTWPTLDRHDFLLDDLVTVPLAQEGVDADFEAGTIPDAILPLYHQVKAAHRRNAAILDRITARYFPHRSRHTP